MFRQARDPLSSLHIASEALCSKMSAICKTPLFQQCINTFRLFYVPTMHQQHTSHTLGLSRSRLLAFFLSVHRNKGLRVQQLRAWPSMSAPSITTPTPSITACSRNTQIGCNSSVQCTCLLPWISTPSASLRQGRQKSSAVSRRVIRWCAVSSQ